MGIDFAEQGLGITKTVGDLVGPMMFSILMGTSRLIYGKFGDRMNLDRFMKLSCALCVAAYLCISLVPNPVMQLIGCGICGFSVGIMWPGTFSRASASLKRGGTALLRCWRLQATWDAPAARHLWNDIERGRWQYASRYSRRCDIPGGAARRPGIRGRKRIKAKS